MSLRAVHAGIAALIAVIAAPAYAAEYLAPAGAQTIEFKDLTGAPATGFAVDGPATFTVFGPAELLISCYRAAPGKFTMKVRVGSGPLKTRVLTARFAGKKRPAGLRALGAIKVAVPKGETPVVVDALGCTLALGGATLGTKSLTRVTTEEQTVVVKEPGKPLPPAPAQRPSPAAPKPPPPHSSEAIPLVTPSPEPTPAPTPEPAAAPEPAPAAATVEASPPPAPASEPHELGIRASIRVGALIPRTELGSGFAVAGDVGYALPVLERRVSVVLGAGYGLSPYQGPKIIPGRGYDPHFTQNTTFIPISLAGRFRQPLRDSKLALYGGAGVELLVVSASFQSFSASSGSNDATVGVALEGGAEYAVGPGALVAELRYAEARADFGPLGQTGQDGLGHFLLTAGYALHF